MSVAPPSAQPAPERRIGDILLAHGFASEEALADASAEQERTGQPLGQILVARGVITRLELASALAEQWSDQSASISVLPVVPQPAPRPAPQQHHEDAQYAARLQDAVADLAQRMHETRPDSSVAERVTDLAERVEATVARSQRLEATIATLAESLEGVTGGVEDAFGALQAGMAGLALDLARIDTTVADLAAAPAKDAAPEPALVAQLEGLASAVQELAARPVADPTMHDRVADLAARLEGVADNQALTDVQAVLAGLEERLDVLAADDHAQAEIGTQLADRLETVADATEVQRLAARVEATSALQEQVAETIAALGGRLDELATARSNDDTVDERLAGVAGENEALAATLESLRQSLAEAAGAEELEQLRARVEQIAAERDATETLTAKLDDLEARLASTTAPSAPDERVDRITDELKDLAARIEQRAPTPTPDVSLVGEIEVLTERLDRLAAAPDTMHELAAKIDGLEVKIAQLATSPASDERVDRLGDQLDALAGRLEQLDTTATADVSLTTELETLTERVEQLAAALAPSHDLVAKLEAVEARLGDDLATAAMVELAVREVRAELAAVSVPRPADTAAVEDSLAQLTERLAGLEAIAGRVDELAEAVAGNTAPSAPAPGNDLREELELRLAELTRTVDERLAAATVAPKAGAGAAEPEGLEGEMERARMAIERLGHQLSGHDRAIKELMGSRGAGGGRSEPSYGEGAAETAADMRSLIRRLENSEDDARLDRERLMSRLERMATSIDWRLQRLETHAQVADAPH